MRGSQILESARHFACRFGTAAASILSIASDAQSLMRAIWCKTQAATPSLSFKLMRETRVKFDAHQRRWVTAD
jgi:hypothetical protein